MARIRQDRTRDHGQFDPEAGRQPLGALAQTQRQLAAEWQNTAGQLAAANADVESLRGAFHQAASSASVPLPVLRRMAQEMQAAQATAGQWQAALTELQQAAQRNLTAGRQEFARRRQEEDRPSTVGRMLQGAGQSYVQGGGASGAMFGAMGALGPYGTAAALAIQGSGVAAQGAYNAVGSASSGGVDKMLEVSGGSVAQMFQNLGSKMSPFIDALNPSAVQVFSIAMKDLHAVIGVALMPVFSSLTTAVKQASSLFLPLTEQLAPIFAEMAGVWQSGLQPVMQVAVNLFGMLATPLKLFADTMSVIAPLWEVMGIGVAAVTKTLRDMLGSLLGANYNDAVSGFRSSMQRLAVSAIVAAGALAKLFGADTFLKNLIQATRGGDQKSAEGLGAATGGRITDVRGFDREQMAAAFTATQGAVEKKATEDYLAEAVKKLQEIHDGQASAGEMLVKAVKEAQEAVDASVQKAIDVIIDKIKPPAWDGSQENAVVEGLRHRSLAKFWEAVLAPRR